MPRPRCQVYGQHRPYQRVLCVRHDRLAGWGCETTGGCIVIEYVGNPDGTRKGKGRECVWARARGRAAGSLQAETGATTLQQEAD